MLWDKMTSNKIKTEFDISDYIDVTNKELLKSDLKLVDHNDMIYIYKKECEIPQYGVYFTQYYFKRTPEDHHQKLTKEDLLNTYGNSGCILELKVFLIDKDVIQLNEFGHLALFDIINSHADRRDYQLLQYETLLAKSS